MGPTPETVWVTHPLLLKRFRPRSASCLSSRGRRGHEILEKTEEGVCERGEEGVGTREGDVKEEEE